MEKPTKQERPIEDLPVEAEQAAEIKGGPTAVELNSNLVKALNFSYQGTVLNK